MEFDTDINNYSDMELFQLLDIDKLTPTIDEIIQGTQNYIDKYKTQPELVKFYTDIRNRFQHEGKENEKNPSKGIIDSDYLKNTISRIVNIDSTFRVYTPNIYSNDADNYLFTLNEPITNVISLMLYSVEIPQSWYTFAESKGNTVFQPILIAENADGTSVQKYDYPVVQINDGNYTSKALLQSITLLLRQTGIFVNQPTTISLEQDAYTGRCKIMIAQTFTMNNIKLPDGITNLDMNKYTRCKIGFLFHSLTLKTKINYNLGWLLGFRFPYVIISTIFYPTQAINVIEYSYSIIDTIGTKYIILKLDDFKTNRLNKSVVNINTKTEQTIALPSYYNRTLPQIQTSPNTINVTSNAGLTAKQIFTINSISNSYNTDINSIQLTFPNISDIFAKLPIKRATDWGVMDANGVYTAQDNGPGKLVIEFSGPLQLATRDYFGPVDITTFSVALYDDKGMPLGLNGMDWSFTLIAKSLINVN